MSRISRFFAACLVAALTIMPAAAAHAQPASWASVDVTAQSYQQNPPMLLVSGQLPAETSLPAEAELAVPAGSQLQWIGEVLGGDPAKDPSVQYTMTTVDGHDVYRFTMSTARIAQVEVSVPQWTAADAAGGQSSKLAWTAWRDLPEVRISERLPSGAQISQGTQDASLQPGDAGFSYYTKTVKDVKAGDTVGLEFAYTVGAAPAAGAAGAAAKSPSDTMIIVLLVTIAAALLGLLAYNVNRKMNGGVQAAAPTPKPKAAKPASKAVAPQASVKAEAQARSAAHHEDEDDAEQAVAAPRSAGGKLIVPAVAIVGVLVVVAFTVAGQGTKATVAGNTIKKSFGAPNPCANTSIPVTAVEGVDLRAQGETLVDAFKGQDGITDVTLDLDRMVVDVAFCESSQSDESLRKTLAATGLVEVAAAAPAPAPVSAVLDESGKLQTAEVGTSEGGFAPGVIKLKADVPAKVTFGTAAGCVTEVVSEALGLNQPLAADKPTTIELDGLAAGTYAFQCAMGHATGQFVVE